MPIREHACLVDECYLYGEIAERFFHPSEDIDQYCPGCHTKMVCLASAFGVIGTGELAGGGGHWAVCKKDWDGKPLAKPEHVYIDTPAKQDSYVKREGLVHPKNLSSQADRSASQIGTHASGLELDREKLAKQKITEGRRELMAKLTQ